MWNSLAHFVLKYKLLLLVLLIGLTVLMGFQASKVQMSYEFSKAIPTDNPKYQDYVAFKEKFGDDGNTMVLGFPTDSLYSIRIFNAMGLLHQQLRKVAGVDEILSIPEASTLVKADSTKLSFVKIFHYPYASQALLDSDKNSFKNLPFYRGLLYNDSTHASLMVVRVNRDTANSKSRTRLMNDIMQRVNNFKNTTSVPVHVSGLPYIRTNVANRIQQEMYWFLIGSLILSAITLLLFF